MWAPGQGWISCQWDLIWRTSLLVRRVIPFLSRDWSWTCHRASEKGKEGERVWALSESTLPSKGFSDSVGLLTGVPRMWPLVSQGVNIFTLHSENNTPVGRIKLLTLREHWHGLERKQGKLLQRKASSSAGTDSESKLCITMSSNN